MHQSPFPFDLRPSLISDIEKAARSTAVHHLSVSDALFCPVPAQSTASIPPQEKPSGTAPMSSAKTNSRMVDKSRKKPRTSGSGQTPGSLPALDNGHSTSPPSNLRTPLFLAALISLMSTNLEIIVDVVLQPCLSTPIWLLLYLSQLLMGY